jgi:hypothetical protein
MDRLQAFGQRLRAQYNLPNPQRGFSYRGCQIAVEVIPERHGDDNRFVASWLIVRNGEVRRAAESAHRFEVPGDALALGEQMARQDVDRLFDDGFFA